MFTHVNINDYMYVYIFGIHNIYIYIYIFMYVCIYIYVMHMMSLHICTYIDHIDMCVYRRMSSFTHVNMHLFYACIVCNNVVCMC